MLFLLTLFGCPQPKPTYSCKADENWILNPQQPSDVAPSESFCDFYQFGWEWFLSQTSPSTTNPNQRVFETHRVYHPNTDNQCSMLLEKGRKHQI